MKIVNAIERLAYYVEAAESKTLPADEDAKQAISSAEAKGLTGREKGNAVVDELLKLQDSRNIPANRRVQFDWMEVRATVAGSTQCSTTLLVSQSAPTPA